MSTDLTLVTNPAVTPAPSASALPAASRPLNGRKIRPIIAGGTIGSLIAGIVVTVILAIVTAVLTAQGIVPLGSWQFKLLVGIAGTIGSAQLLSITGLVVHYFREKARREQKARLLAAASHGSPPPSTPSTTTTTSTTSATTTATATAMATDTTTTTTTATTSATTTATTPSTTVTATTATTTTPPAAPPQPLLEVSETEWATRLNQAALADGPAEFNFNLAAPPGTPVAQKMAHMDELYQLPLFGKYNPSAPQFKREALVMAARLPKQQKETLPVKLRNWLDPQLEQNTEYHCLVFNNSDPSIEGQSRNFAMHPWALPEYDKQHPTNIPNNTDPRVRLNKHNDGIATDMQITMDGLQGIVPDGKETGIRFRQKQNFVLNLHGQPNEIPACSPNNASFAIEKGVPVSSGYFVAKARGKIIVFHAIFLNTKAAHNEFVSAARKGGSMQGLVNELETNDFACANEIKKTFTHPDQLPAL